MLPRGRERQLRTLDPVRVFKLLCEDDCLNIATHNLGKEFSFRIRSSTTENTCSGTQLKHYELIRLLEQFERADRVV